MMNPSGVDFQNPINPIVSRIILGITVGSMLLKALVGIARLHAPRSLQVKIPLSTWVFISTTLVLLIVETFSRAIYHKTRSFTNGFSHGFSYSFMLASSNLL